MNKTRLSVHFDEDFLICIAVFIQSPLILLQHVLIDVFGMSAEATTPYRVILTAIPMLFAIYLSIHRKPRLFLFTYIIAFILLLTTIVFFPQNTPYVMSEGLRFLLPVVIPSALCLASVRSLEASERALLAMSWVSAIFVFFYVFAYLRGFIVFDSYNMSFSYGCLLPMIALFYRKSLGSIVASLIMFLAVVAIGSRGAAVVFVCYVIADTLFSNSKGTFIILLAGIVFLLFLPLFSTWLGDLGISSRTISLYSEGDLISYDAGRGEIYSSFSFDSVEHPLLGIGLYGDRYYTGGGYCHNVLLEICIDFGFILGPIIILVLFAKLVQQFFMISLYYKRVLLKYVFFGLLPLMVSGSYLQSPYLSILIGMSCLIGYDIKMKVTN